MERQCDKRDKWLEPEIEIYTFRQKQTAFVVSTNAVVHGAAAIFTPQLSEIKV